MSSCFLLTSTCKKSRARINASLNKIPLPLSINFEMDKKDHQFHSLDICNRLYNFFTKIASDHAFKTVKLGHPVPQNLARTKNGAMAMAIHESGHRVRSRNQGVAPVCEGVKQQAKYSLKRSGTFPSSCYSSDEQDGKELPTEEAPLPYSLVRKQNQTRSRKNVTHK
ncbi:hypothetical protein OIU85_004997 [Salix viminalis]|uniref:Uncharacterized protein n=1 Tax=Salix viminalis TaxID=40686 RepID=A0A9Q0PTM6_SALVM|nr:hypothetical protein OIU85_004997 [Salix viminalis]